MGEIVRDGRERARDGRESKRWEEEQERGWVRVQMRCERKSGGENNRGN